MKLKFNAILALAAIYGAVFAAEPAKKESKPAPAPAPESEADEIDLDKLDDSADAARKAPTVKMADRKSTRLNSSHTDSSRMPSSA